MDFKVTFSKSALRELEEIVNFIGTDDPDEAKSFRDKLLKKAISLHRFPFRHARFHGRANVRKLPFSSYIIFYRINEIKRRVVVLHFWHGARQPPFL